MMKQTLSFRLLWLGQGLANFGDTLYIMAIVTLVYHTTHSVAISAMIPVVRMGTQLVSGILAPLLLERFHLRSLMVLAQSGQILLFASLAAGLLFIPSFFGTAQILLFISALAFLEGWNVPTRNALVPRLLPQEAWIKANSLLATTDQIVLLLGFSMGGLIVEWIGSQTTLWLTIGFFIISTISLFFIRESNEKETSSNQPRQSWTVLKEGWAILFTHPVLKKITLIDLFENTSGGAWVGAIILAFVHEVLHRSEAWWGYINGSYFAGTVIGGALIVTFSKWMERRIFLALFLGNAGVALFGFVYATNTIPWIALLLCFIVGPFYQMREIARRTVLQTQVSLEKLPNVYAARYAFTNTLFALGVMVLGYVADHMGVKTAYLLAASLDTCGTLIALTLRKQKMKIPSSSTSGS